MKLQKILSCVLFLLSFSPVSGLKAGCADYRDELKPRAVVLCFKEICEKARLEFECANVHGAQRGYRAARTSWHVEYTEGKQFVSISEGRLSHALTEVEVKEVFCVPMPGNESHCSIGTRLNGTDDYFKLVSSGTGRADKK